MIPTQDEKIEKKSFDENVKDFQNVGDNLRQAVYHAHDIEMYEFFKDMIEPKQLPEPEKINNNETN